VTVLPRFAPGDRVTVLDLDKPGHVRIPRYVRGHSGVVEQFCGAFLNPEDLSVGRVDGPVVCLYRVCFEQPALWADYAGSPGDLLHIEIYEHWLETGVSE